MRRAPLALGLVAIVLLLTAAPAGAHPLGNFTVNHYNGLRIEPTRIVNTAVIDSAEIPTAQLLPALDGDGDGVTEPGETHAYAERRCSDLAGALRLEVGGERATLASQSGRLQLRPGVAGLKVARLTCRLVAPVSLREGGTVSFRDPFESGRVGWREITATADGLRIDRSSVPERSISNELRTYPDDLLSSPLDVRAATVALRPGSGTALGVPESFAVPTTGLVGRTVGRVTATFNDLVGRRDLTLRVGLLAVALALLLGASHAALPGHGKTVMAAYLAGRQGSARDAVMVGATVTATHTSGVLLLGLALTVSASLVGETVLSWLGVASGLLVAAVGIGLLRSVFLGRSGGHGHSHGPAGHSDEHHGHEHHGNGHHDHHGNGHHDHHEHGHHDHHEHGHHEHGPARVTRRGLVGMGIAGGLVPSPSALVVLLSAIALGRTLFGVLLVLCYGLGMAATLTAAGLLLVKVRDRVQARRRGRPQRMAWLARRGIAALPFATACLVVVVGLALAGRSLGSV